MKYFNTVITFVKSFTGCGSKLTNYLYILRITWLCMRDVGCLTELDSKIMVSCRCVYSILL